MKLVKINPRTNYKQKLEDIQFKFHSLDCEYWDESKYYQFSMNEVLNLEEATNTLYEMCLDAVQYVIDNRLYDKLHINPRLIPLIEQSWEEEHASVYGRFDLAYDGENIKMLEFNADTPTSLYEGSVVQWFWLQDVNKNADQFNSIHEKLVDYWKSCDEYFDGKTVYFRCIKDSIEDLTTTEYLMTTAKEAGLKTRFIYLEDVGYDHDNNQFVDLSFRHINHIFRLYPYEWLSNEEYGKYLDKSETLWIEPPWKAILSNKGILPILWEMYPNHPLLLECYFDDPNGMSDYVAKPIYSREGANIEIVREGETTDFTEGEYGEEGYIFQEFFDIPSFDGNYPIIGSWVIGGESGGMGIREASTRVTGNLSKFIPHLIK